MESGSEYSPSNEESSEEETSDEDLMTIEEIEACIGSTKKLVGKAFRGNVKTAEEPGYEVVKVPENDDVVVPENEDQGCDDITPLPEDKIFVLETDLPGCDDNGGLDEANQEIVVLLPNGIVYPDEEDRALEPVQNFSHGTPDDTLVLDHDDVITVTPDDLIPATFFLNEPGDSLNLHDKLSPGCGFSDTPGSTNDTIDPNMPNNNDEPLVPENPRAKRTEWSPTRSSEPKKKRNVFATPAEWKKNVSKQARERGESYIGYRRVMSEDGSKKFKVVQDSPKAPRVIGPTCNSNACKRRKNRLCSTVTEEERLELFETFWKKMTKHSRKTFVCSTVKEMKPVQVSQKSKSGRQRTSSFFYHLKVNGEQIPVCQSMYLSTLGIKRSEVRYWLENFRKYNKPDQVDGSKKSDKCDNLGNQSSASSSSLRRASKTHQHKTLNEFINSLPLMPSHYCRKDSSKKFLQADIKNWAQLYEWYTNVCNEKNEAPLSKTTFTRERKRRKLGIFQPKKDRCDTCLSYERGNVAKDLYDAHIVRKDAAQSEKQKDKIMGEAGMVHVICFDLMNVQTVPKTRSSSAYYKLKLMMHNFTIYNLCTHDAQNYWWDESEGNLSASVFTSCIIDYLHEVTMKEKRDIILYSDGCNYQNRNSVLSNALLQFSQLNNVTITHKYLEKGHTYMEGDSVHSTIERYIEDKDLDLPSQFVSASIQARKFPMPYRAKFLDHSFFKDYSGNIRYASIRPGKNRPNEPKVTDLRVLQYQPNGKITFKLNFDDQFKCLPTRPKDIDLTQISFPRLFMTRLKIPKDKYADLQSMKPILHKDAWYYYDHIPHEEESIRGKKRQTMKTEEQQGEKRKKPKK